MPTSSTKGAASKVDLPAEIFDAATNIPLIHQVVVAQQAAARQGTHATKTRGQVSGGGTKPYRQKGTGRARQGSIRAPQFAGGGVVHGPQPRSYDQRTPKKMKAAALRGALSDRARNDRIHVVDGLVSGDKPSTKAALASLAGLSDRTRFLVVLERTDAVTWLSLRNAAEVHIVAVDQLNTYDVLASEDIVFTRGAYDEFVARHSKGGAPATAKVADTPATTEKPAAKAETKPAAKKAAEPKTEAKAAEPKTEAKADEPKTEAKADEKPVLPKGAKAPLKSGNAPKGYEIKANESSMKFHEPDGQWYDATDPDLWFKTAEDAEAAGYTRAGDKEGDK
jgi:large subunit ribosomal protein L4